MRILHVSLASVFTEGMTYQDNLLVDQNRKDGHDVCVVADCSVYRGGVVVQTHSCDVITEAGVRIVRLPLVSFGIDALTYRLRCAPGLRKILDEFHPDVILYHGIVGFALWTVGRYKKWNPNVKVYLDSHEDFHNSGRSWVSRVFQYRFLTRFLLSRIRKDVEKILYVSYEVSDFLREMYGLREDEMEFYPLGGFIPSDHDRKEWRSEVRSAYGIDESEIVLVHTGKLDRGKKTSDLLEAFRSWPDVRMRLLIAGSLPSETDLDIRQGILADSRVTYIGWVSGNQLLKVLCAGDLYVQPGTQSATLQMALCCGLPVMIFPYRSHAPYMAGNGYLVRTQTDMVQAFQEISRDPSVLASMALNSMNIAHQLLDYRILSARLYR